MSLKEKLKWGGQLDDRFRHIQETKTKIASGKAKDSTYYWFVGQTACYAVEVYVIGNNKISKEAAQDVVQAALDYFYGDWRNRLQTPDGHIGHEQWKPFCLWYEQLIESLPFAGALSDWEAVRKIAAYPPDNKLPKPTDAKGETAWVWALITFLRNEPREKIESFIKKAEGDKAKRPKLLCPVLRALMNNDAAEFERTLLAYLAYYRKSEFKRELMKLVSLDGTTLYHLGCKQGFYVALPENVADHIIRFED